MPIKVKRFLNGVYMITKTAFLLCCMLGCATSSMYAAAGSQSPMFVTIPLPNQQKLPHSEVYRIFEDSEGYMWYATRVAGLCRDNGYQVDVFRSDRDRPDLLRSNDVTCIAENRNAREIWFGTKQGGYVLNKHGYEVRTLPGIVNHVRDIVQSDDGSMWVAANKQVKVFSPDGEPQDSFALSWKGNPMSVETMTLDSQGTLWLMQWNGGIQTIDTRTRQLNTMNWEEPVGPTSLAEDSIYHYYFVGTWGAGVYRYDGQKAVPLTPELTGTMERKVRSVHYDKWRNLLWVATMAGIYVYEIGSDGMLTPCPMAQFGLPSQLAVYRLYFDHRGNVWVPSITPLSFVLYPTNGKWMNCTSFESLTQKVGVRLPVENLQSEGRYNWMWSDRTQLVLYDRQTEQLALAGGRPDDQSTRFGNIMTKRRKGGIWCATGRKVYSCEHDGMKIQLSEKPIIEMKKPVAALAEDGNGRLFVGTADGLYCYNPDADSLTVIAEGIRTVRDIVTAPTGKVFFISVEKGICQYDGGSGYEVIAPYQRFTTLACDGNGRLWAANAYGDVWQADQELKLVPVASSKEGNGVKRLLIDPLGHLWVMGDTYLIEYLTETDRRRMFRSSNKEMALDNFGGISLDNDGQVVVAGAGGIMTLVPKKLYDSGRTAQPVVAAYSVNGQKQLISNGIDREITVPSNVVTLELELTNFNILKAGEQQFAYRIKGLSDQWIEIPQGENTLRIVNLPKGDYVLELKVCDSYAHWGEPVEVLSIYREPAWYETWQAYLCYLLIVAAVVAWVVRIYLMRSKEKTQRQMEERLAEMKLRFFTNVSHELRTPLSLIITPIESLMKRVDEPVRDKLEGILKQANELLALVNRLLDFRKIDMGELKLRPQNGDILGFLRSCADTFTPLAVNKGIELKTVIPEGTLYTEFDSQAMQHVMYNLLSNAVKFTEKGCVTVDVKTGEKLRITVSDTGTGIAREELVHIFDRYYQAANANDTTIAGSGIGLNMVKELVMQMGGVITADSKLGVGTTFTVVLPPGKTVSDEQELPISPVIPKLPTILLADDNDDFRDFLVGELNNDYNILQARNGKEALKMAQTHYVDVILSDVMMPQMDGNELCRQLKQDESTSHIFIILLTAKTAEESRLEGYEAGADYYLTKPFSLELLRNRLSHLALMQQQRIELLAKAELSGSIDTAASLSQLEDGLCISPIDRKFMVKMKETMEKHMADTSFGVDVFCSEMNMSRMNFYRKMHALTGVTPAQYITDHRLALADRLLHEGELNVTEIADRTGFSTASYFSKCYKAKFGIAPKDARSK